jgi:hypothetical protein
LGHPSQEEAFPAFPAEGPTQLSLALVGGASDAIVKMGEWCKVQE